MSTLPLKWAVEITSPQDAERLQALFPRAVFNRNTWYSFAKWYNQLKDSIPNLCAVNGVFWYGVSKKVATENGYTIYTITELETILNER